MGLSEFVTFTGRVDHSTLFKVLSTADVCVNPDRPNALNDLSTMNKILEYMTPAQSASLYARNTDPADFGDKILELIDDPDRCQEMGMYGRQRVRDELSWEHEEPKLIAAYEALFKLESDR